MPAPTADGPRPGRATAPDCDLSFIFTSGEHEMVSLPETSPWAEKYGAGPRQRLADTAFIDYDYNTGRFCSRVAPLWNAGRFTAACNAMSWPSRDHAGHLLSGLVRRRNYEVKLCLSGLQ